MRILMVTDCFLPTMGGIEMVVSRLAERLVERGHEVVVATAADADGFDDSTLPYSVVRSVWKNPFHTPVDPRAPRRFVELVEKWHPDVVHIHQGEVSPVAQATLLRQRRAGLPVPVVLTVHSVWSRRTTIPLFRALSAFDRRGRQQVTWTGVSRLVADRMREAFGDIEVEVLPNGVRTQDWRRPAREHDGVVVACATRFAPRKRVLPLLDILEAAARSLGWTPEDGWPAGRVPLRAVIAGAGGQFDAAQRQIRDRGLAELVVLPGRLSSDQLADLYAGADIYAAPGVQDAMVLAAAEAWAAGLAVVTRAQSGFAELIDPGVTGATAATDRDMARILARWADDPEELGRIVAHNRSTLPSVDDSMVVPLVEDVYRRAAERAAHHIAQRVRQNDARHAS